MQHVGHMRRRTYKAILELSARHPMLNPRDLALMLGANEQWVRQVMKSDAFKAQRAQLIEELFGPKLEEIRNKMLDTTSKLIEAIAHRIADPDAIVSEDTLLKATALLLDRIAPVKGASLPQTNTPPAQHVKIVLNGVSPEDLDRARQAALNRSPILELEAQQHEQLTTVDEDGLPTDRRVRSNEGID